LDHMRGDESGGAGDEHAHQILMNSRNSWLPAGPSIGDSVGPSTRHPCARTNAATFSTASKRFSGSRTTPPLPTSPLPTSNCGLTSATIGFSPRAGGGAGGGGGGG